MVRMQPNEEKDKSELYKQLDQLRQDIETFAASGTAVHEVERHLFRKLMQVGYALLVYFFRLQGSGDQGPQVERADGRTLKRLEGLRERCYRSIFGDFALKRWVYGTREKQAQAYVPLDARLQLPGSAYSYLVQDWAQKLAVEFSYEQVSEVLMNLLGVRFGVSALERMNQEMAETAAGYWQEAPTPSREEGDFIVISGDGKGVPMRQPSTSPPIVAHDGHRGPAKDRKKIAIVGAGYDAKAEVRTPEAVVKSLFRGPWERAAAMGQDRPQHVPPIAKRVRASLTHTAANGQEVNARDEIFPWLGEQVRQRDPRGHKPVVVVMDGQTCFWSDAQAALGERRRVEVLDLLHVNEKLWEVVRIFEDPSRHRFVMESYVSLVLDGRSLELAALFRHRALQQALGPAERKTVAAVCGYFEANRERMRYDQYLAAGYPIASGVIEGACRHVVKDRLERTGMHWTVNGAQAMLNLRSIAINGQWDEFTAFRIQRECQRLYPHTVGYEVEAWPLGQAA